MSDLTRNQGHVEIRSGFISGEPYNRYVAENGETIASSEVFQSGLNSAHSNIASSIQLAGGTKMLVWDFTNHKQPQPEKYYIDVQGNKLPL